MSINFVKKPVNNVSVIIPTYNEEGNIGPLVKHLWKVQKKFLLEVIVVDGGSSDNTVHEATSVGAKVFLSPEKGRAAQMNYGAEKSAGDVFYFLHADTFPPAHFDQMIVDCVTKAKPWGSFRMRFDYPHWFLKCTCWFTRFNTIYFRFGDQSLFVTKELFEEVSGFDTSQIIFEDTEMVRQLLPRSKGEVIPHQVISSARKFRENGPYKMSFVFLYLWVLYLLKFPHNKILLKYKKMIVQDKI